MYRLRFLTISILHWIASIVLSTALALYVLTGFTGYVLAAPMWAMNFLLAFGFAQWAFHQRLPGPRDTMWFLLIWFIVTFSLQSAFEIYQFGQIYFLINDNFLHIQYFIDLLAILLASYLTRRWKVKSVLSEGMVD